ncbi:hypothetical protein A9Q86_05665 [Flavobacteriales bacterium 33_180_T64]|nr:hypothetical protein A9Q86_05665 [Flavobacteriales bacterium 33_180_T64]
MKTKITLLFTLLSFWFSTANNINVSNISLENFDSVNNWVQVEFDLSWENSWRLSSGPSNWDAAWVFIKYRYDGGTWRHCSLSQVDNVAAAGSIVDVSADTYGAFVYRDVEGSGTNTFQDMRLRWDIGSIPDDAVIDVQVFAIEMVNIPQGTFSVGGKSGDEQNKFHRGSSSNFEFFVTSEAEITVTNSGTTNLYYTSDNGGGGDHLGPVPAAFKKGFDAFYIMKYEVSEAQWVAYFNLLTEVQKVNRDLTDATHKNSDNAVSRNTISWTGGSNNATTTAPDRAVSYISPADMNSYLDWSALRPMTELEFEKASRGPIAVHQGEFAWGNDNIATSDYTLSFSGQTNEIINNLDPLTGNASYLTTDASINGPLRCGIFAASAINKSREETGGSYYGVMELSGNLYERCVSVGNPVGRSFTGNHGNGVISYSGSGTASLWPNSTTGNGYGFRGGSWLNSENFLRISDRFDAATDIATGNSRLGLRGARTAQ